MNDIYILVVEDDPNDVKLMQASISSTKAKLKLVFVNNGEEALDYLLYKNTHFGRTDPDPNLIILDINIPLLDGFDVLKKIKSDNHLKSIPVVAFTSSSYDLDITKCYNLGINSYVVKPMDFVNYKKTVSQMINFWVDINLPPFL